VRQAGVVTAVDHAFCVWNARLHSAGDPERRASNRDGQEQAAGVA
jgi:hypothetical protein